MRLRGEKVNEMEGACQARSHPEEHREAMRLEDLT
jgi:hypothetical protein